MDFILNIHSATETAIVNICNEEKVLLTVINEEPKQHAAFLHPAIHQILRENNISINRLKAIGATAGPGSYTGIRVGLATAKGLCFALKIPLISFNVLELMARSAIEAIHDKKALYCPMIDARRLEVFMAVYNYNMEEQIPPSAIVIAEDSFEKFLQKQPVYFCGSGSKKLKGINKSSFPANFLEEEINSAELAKLSWGKYKRKEFDSVDLAEALYIKEFHSAD